MLQLGLLQIKVFLLLNQNTAGTLWHSEWWHWHEAHRWQKNQTEQASIHWEIMSGIVTICCTFNLFCWGPAHWRSASSLLSTSAGTFRKKHTHTPSSTMQICVQGLSQSVYHTKLWITATNKAQALAKMLTKPCNTSRCFASNSTRCHQNQWNGINPPHLHHLVHERHNVMSNRLWTSVWSRQGWNALYPSHCTNPLCTVCNNGLGVTILFSCKVDRASHNWTNSFLHYRDDHTDAKKVLLAVDIIGSPLQWANQQQQAALLQRSFTDSLDK